MLLKYCALFLSFFCASSQNEDDKLGETLRTLSKMKIGVQAALNSTLDPCNDFYDFVCKAFDEQHNTLIYNSQMSIMAKMATIQFEAIIQALQSQKSTREQQLALDYLNDCLNPYPANESIYLKQYFEMQERYENVSDFTDYHIDLFPNYVYFKLTPFISTKNSSLSVLQLSPTFHNVHSSSRSKSSIKAILEALGEADTKNIVFTNSKAEITRRLDNLFAVTNELIKIDEKYEVSDEITETTLGNLSDIITLVDLEKYVLSILPELPTMNISIKDIPVEASYLEQIREFDNYFSSLDDRVLNDYLDFLLVKELADYMGSRIEQMYWRIINYSEEERELDRKKRCFQKTMTNFGDVTGQQYITKYMPKEVRDEVQRITENVKKAFINNVKQLTWMDPKTKAEALKKAQDMKYEIGFTEGLFDQKQMVERYSTLIYPEPRTPYTTARAYRMWRKKRAFKKLFTHSPLFYNDPLEVNAYYVPIYNKLYINAAIIQEPFFNINNSLAENYGSLGPTIGHEITHGFDDEGATRDAQGNLRNWWQPESMQLFKNKSQCFIDQYKQYNYAGRIENSGTHINGEQTLGENIADNGGLAAAFAAFLEEVKHNKENVQSQSEAYKNYTAEQVFFISYANFWCERVDPKFENYVHTDDDTHSPAKVRVNVAVSNNPNFAKAFQCNEKSKMLEKEKCAIW